VVRKNGGGCSEQEKYYAKCKKRRGPQNRTSKNDCELAFLYNLRIRRVKQDDFAAVSQFGSGRSKHLPAPKARGLYETHYQQGGIVL
jgi:hypothetical protein